jgi:hypothetical protein
MAAYDGGKYGTESTAYAGTGQPVDENMSVGRYLATRFSTLKPPMNKAPNPFSLLRMLNKQQWLFFLVGFFGWTWDAFDFFTVSLVSFENIPCAHIKPPHQRILISDRQRRLLPSNSIALSRISLGGKCYNVAYEIQGY